MVVNKVYSYIVAEDNGYSPNPFGGVLTLPWCKPPLRKAIAKYYNENSSQSSDSGIWLVGLSRKSKDGYNHLIYIANINEILTHDQYFHAYPQKHPQMAKSLEHIYHVGDNCYFLDPTNPTVYSSLESVHSHDPSMQSRDLSVPYVLLSHNFIYYGNQAPKLPDTLEELRVGQGFKSNFSQESLVSLQNYIAKELIRPTMVLGSPHVWPSDDHSWKEISI